MAIAEPVIANFFVTPLENLVTVQNRVDASFTVSLASEPGHDVILPLKMTNPKAGTLSADELIFTHNNWDKSQTVTVTGAEDVMPEDETAYQIVVGPSKSEDANYNGLNAVNIQVKHYNQFNTLKLDKTEASLLLRKVKTTSAHDTNSVTFTVIIPNSAEDKSVEWKISNLTDGDKVDVNKLVKWTVENDEKAGKSTITITRYDHDLKSDDTRKNHLDWARTLQVSASTKDSQSIDAKLELKPYLPLGFNYTYYSKNIKNFSYSADVSNDISCEYYDLHTIQVLNEDMYRYYVEPNMVKNDKDELVPSRASVLAAARFLVLQFPKDIPYSGTHKCVSIDEKTERGADCTVGKTTFSSYIWTSDKYNEGENYKDKQLFGLSLSKNGYNSLTDFEHPIKNDMESWGCSYQKYINEKQNKPADSTIYSIQGRVVKYPDVGMCCSAFVSWVLRNGLFDLGKIYISVFSRQVDNNTKRMYTDKAKLYKSVPINEAVNTYEKLAGLKESDFIPLSAVDKANTVGMKAGDLLYYSSPCTCEKGQKCPDECICNEGGHLAMILGIYYKTVNGKKEISGIYVAEAQSAGNRMTHWTIDGDSKFAYWNCSNNSCNKNCADEKCSKNELCREVKLIKMGNVYNYYSPKGDTENYTDMWW